MRPSSLLSVVASIFAPALFAGCAQRTLEVEKAGAGQGVVAAEGGATLDCGDTCTSPMTGAAIELMASPDDESDFAGWGCTLFAEAADEESLATVTSLDAAFTIGDAPIASSAGPVAFDRVGKAVCEAVFTVEPLFTVVVVGPGRVASQTDDVAIDCGEDCDESVSRGTAVALAALAEGNRFVGWSEGCSGTDTTTLVTVSGATTCKATFVDPATRATLTLDVQGEGTFTSTPAGINACGASGGTCTAEFAKDTDIALAATLPAGFTVEGWSAGCADGELTLTADTTCTVVVLPPPAVVTWNVFLTKSGAGAGTVTSLPTGIDCGDACTAADDTFTEATTVSLTGAASGAATFGGFTCGCAYSGVAPGTVTCAVSGGTGAADPTVAVTLNGLDDARGRDVVVRLDCAAAFAP